MLGILYVLSFTDSKAHSKDFLLLLLANNWKKNPSWLKMLRVSFRFFIQFKKIGVYLRDKILSW